MIVFTYNLQAHSEGNLIYVTVLVCFTYKLHIDHLTVVCISRLIVMYNSLHYIFNVGLLLAQ